jgi:hypothetical protein
MRLPARTPKINATASRQLKVTIPGAMRKRATFVE